MWQSINQMFAALNRSGLPYIVLRNWEELESENIFLNGHPDIDFLTSDRKKMMKIIQAERRFLNDRDGSCYKAYISGQQIDIDIRYVGDGYYDRLWEKEMLKHRRMWNKICYVCSDEEYYYSLVYHAILQKKELTEEYRSRLSGMSQETGAKEIMTQEGHLQRLEQYMKQHRYLYTYPMDPHVPFRKELIPHTMLKKQCNVYVRDAMWVIRSIGSKMKRGLSCHKAL